MIFRRVYGNPLSVVRAPFPGLSSMRQQMDQLFDALTGSVTGDPSAGVFPLTNVTENKDSYFVRCELPGVKSDELDIQVTGKGLSISGERRIAEEGDNVRYHRREREAGKFSRFVALPNEVDTGKVDASLKDGVLTMAVPKSEAAKPRQIAVK